MRNLVRAAIGAAILVAGVPAMAAEEGAFKRFTDIVDHAFMQEHAVVPVREDVLIVDSRPGKRRYDPGHIPGAINIPHTFFDKFADRLPKDKSSLVVFYCGGLDCPLSHNSAYKAKSLGYSNVKVYAAGFPEWAAKGNLVSVSASYVKALVDKPDGTVLVDARPARRFKEGSIPGAINIPDTFFDKLVDKLPADKATRLLFFCGGVKCALSSKSALKAKALGYTNVAVFAGGYPEWKRTYGKAAD